MVRKTLTIAFLLLLVAGVLYIYYHNSQAVTLSYSSTGTLQQPLGIIIIEIFVAGALFASLIAAFFGIRSHWQVKRLEKQKKELEQQQSLVADARGQLALGNYQAAQQALAKIIHKNPDDITARVLLAEAFRRQKDFRAAQNVLEQARVHQKKNVELLLLASDVHAELGNQTAAYDNAALLLSIEPKNRFALERLVNSSMQLHRVEDAVKYQQQLIKTVSGEDYTRAQETLARLETLAAVRQANGDKEILRKELDSVLRNHRDCPDALALLAELERETGNYENAAKIWKKLFQLTNEIIHLECIAAVWLQAKQPAKAISQVKAALATGTKRQPCPQGRLFLANLLLHLEMLQQAQEEFSEVAAVVEERPDLHAPVALFKAKMLKRQGKDTEALDLFFSSLDAAAALPGETLFRDSAMSNGGTPPGWAARVQEQLNQLVPPAERHLLP